MFIRAPIGMPNVDLLGQQQERDKINPRDDDAGAGCGVSPLKQHRQTACRIPHTPELLLMAESVSVTDQPDIPVLRSALD